MSMKKTDLEKNRMMKMSNLMKVAGIPDRFGKGGMVPDRKELRRLDQAAGLIPFACKLHSELITRLHAEVAKNGTTMNVLVESLLESGLGKPTVNEKPAAAKEKPVAGEKAVIEAKAVAQAAPIAKAKPVAKEKAVVKEKAVTKEKEKVKATVKKKA